MPGIVISPIATPDRNEARREFPAARINVATESPAGTSCNITPTKTSTPTDLSASSPAPIANPSRKS